jgi:hypothetical protein
VALLNEWFLSHKANKATYGLVKMLGEIGRHDVEQIVRKEVDVIPKDMPIDIKYLPPLFLINGDLRKLCSNQKIISSKLAMHVGWI